MKKIIACLLFLAAFGGFAQQTAHPTRTVNGIEYYVYSVGAGEGLFGISQKFGVSQAEINNANPQIHDGLKVGQEILIPRKNASAAPAVANETAYVLHTVERQQTLFAISRKYNVSQAAIIQANPQIGTQGLRTGDVLRIPTTETPAATRQTASRPAPQTLHIGANETYLTHSVAAGETLSAISRKYNVKVDELKRMNADVADNLKIGTVLKIPFGESATNTPTTKAKTPNPAPTIAPKNSQQSAVYKVAFLLPFMTNAKNDPTAQKFVEFYMGALLAINNAKNNDIQLEIYAFDSEKTETKLYELINQPEMQQMNFIVGPAYTAQIPILADFANRHQIYTLVPFSSKITHIETNPFLFQFNPDQEIQYEYVVRLLQNNFRNTNIVFVETGNAKRSDDGVDFFNFLKKGVDSQRIGYGLVKNAQTLNRWDEHLASDRKNIIIFDTDDYRTVQPHLASLHTAGNRYNIGVMGQYAWRNQPGKKPMMYYVSPFAGNDSGTQFYEQEFAKYYKNKRPALNPRYDLLGYDLTTFFLSTMRRNGFSFDANSQTLDFDRGTQSNLHFKRSGEKGGFINRKLYLIEDEAK